MDDLVRKQLHVLVQLAGTDDTFDESEKKVIIRIGKEKGAMQSEIEEIITAPNLKEGLAPMDLTQKIDFILDTIAVIIADKKINPEEEKFAYRIVQKLGFREKVIDFLLEYQSMDRKVLKDMMIPYLATDH